MLHYKNQRVSRRVREEESSICLVTLKIQLQTMLNPVTTSILTTERKTWNNIQITLFFTIPYRGFPQQVFGLYIEALQSIWQFLATCLVRFHKKSSQNGPIFFLQQATRARQAGPSILLKPSNTFTSKFLLLSHLSCTNGVTSLPLSFQFRILQPGGFY